MTVFFFVTLTSLKRLCDVKFRANNTGTFLVSMESWGGHTYPRNRRLYHVYSKNLGRGGNHPLGTCYKYRQMVKLQSYCHGSQQDMKLKDFAGVYPRIFKIPMLCLICCLFVSFCCCCCCCCWFIFVLFCFVLFCVLVFKSLFQISLQNAIGQQLILFWLPRGNH